jgi:hypothetical protein
VHLAGIGADPGAHAIGSGSDGQPLVKHFADLAPEEALRLSSSLPSPASSDIYSRLEKLRHAQTSPDSNTMEIYSTLSAPTSRRGHGMSSAQSPDGSHNLRIDLGLRTTWTCWWGPNQGHTML